jgi:NADH-quinone oxidoreductase subunit N
MTRMSYWEIVGALSPEIVLVLTAFMVLTLDLTGLRLAVLARRRQIVGTMAAMGLVVAVAPLWCLWGGGSFSLIHGTAVVNDLARLFKMVLLLLSFITVLISIDHDLGGHIGEYFATLLFGTVGMMILVSTEELLTLFVALELTSLSLYILTAFHKSALRSQEAAVKYFMFGAISSAFLLFGLSYLVGLTGTTNIRELAMAPVSPLLSVGLIFVLVGLGFKVAVVPFHLWAPDAYEGAPTPVAAFIATGSKVASFVVLTKVLVLGFPGMAGAAFWGNFAPGWVLIIALTGAASMVLGNTVAIVQSNIKRLLAYSSIAHAGYIFVGLAAATSYGVSAVLFYVIVYVLANLGAFGVVAVLASRAGGEELKNFDGMARRSPLLSLLLLVFVLSLAGIPPLGGFFGKFYLFAAAVQRDSVNFGLLWLVVIGILMSAVSLYYYLIILKHVYVHEAPKADRLTTPRYLNYTMAAVALAVIGMGLFPEPILALLKRLVERL